MHHATRVKQSVKTEISSASLQQTRYIPLTEWPNQHPWPRIGGLRHLVFHADSNGFKTVIRRAGRRVLIDEQAFFNWLNNQNRGEK